MPEHMSRQDFEKQFTRLIITARDIPRKTAPYHVLLVSAILGFDPARDYSEADVNAELQRWILEFGRKLKVEHVELRRFLVDAGYLARDTSGSAYRVMPDAGPIALDPDLVIALPNPPPNSRFGCA